MILLLFHSVYKLSPLFVDSIYLYTFAVDSVV
jgi:hypothetical protein